MACITASARRIGCMEASASRVGGMELTAGLVCSIGLQECFLLTLGGEAVVDTTFLTTSKKI